MYVWGIDDFQLCCYLTEHFSSEGFDTHVAIKLRYISEVSWKEL